MIRLIPHFEAYISNDDDVFQTCFVFDNVFEVSSWQFVRTKCRWVVVVGDSAYEFYLQKVQPCNCKEKIKLVKNGFIYFSKLNCVERRVKSLLEIV